MTVTELRIFCERINKQFSGHKYKLLNSRVVHFPWTSAYPFIYLLYLSNLGPDSPWS